jgi:hypothetical protein
MEEKIFYNSYGIKVKNFIIESTDWTIPINEVKQVTSEPLDLYAVLGALVFLCGFYVLFFQPGLLANPSFLDLGWWLGMLFFGLIFFGSGYFFISKSYGVTLHVGTQSRKLRLRELGMKTAKALKQAVTLAIVENLKHN